MRYIILAFPFNLAPPVATDFRLIAYLIAFCRRLFYPEVYVFDKDCGKFICMYCKKKPDLVLDEEVVEESVL